MYILESVKAPKGYRFHEYCTELVMNIKEGKDVEDSKDKLFRLTYPVMLKEMQKYRNIREMEDLVTDLSISFMKAIQYFDINNRKASFTGYYKRTLYTEVIYAKYGKYRKNEETRELKRIFEGSIGSLEEAVHAENGEDVGSLGEIIEDKSINIEQTVLDKDFKSIAHEIIDEMFSEKKRGKKSDMPKIIFTTYIDSILDGDKISKSQLARNLNMARSNISGVIYRYESIFRERLKEYYGEGK